MEALHPLWAITKYLVVLGAVVICMCIASFFALLMIVLYLDGVHWMAGLMAVIVLMCCAYTAMMLQWLLKAGT